MTPTLIFSVFISYTVLLFFITWLTARKATNRGFFIGNKESPWFVVAYGMIGASLSGVTFMSVPGWVGTTQFSYMMVVLGYLVGYAVIATVLMPLYYRLNLTSIYSYLESRFGKFSYKTGAFYFLLSRTIGASFRMFLVVNVLQVFVFDAWNVPFFVTTLIFVVLIILYTFKGGVKTIIWTDTLQTTFMLAALVVTTVVIVRMMGGGFSGMLSQVIDSGYSKMIFTDWGDRRFFLTQFISGAFIAIVMTGLDQEMMQKNLSCRSLKDAQKNMFTFSTIMVGVNFLFLFLGASLFVFANSRGIALPLRSDDLFPTIAFQYLGPVTGMVFLIGLISAAYPSADGALTSLTTSFCIDILGLNKKTDLDERKKQRIRYLVHISFAMLLLTVIVVFRAINDRAVIDKLFTIAGYTYGPLLGLYAFGLFTKFDVKDRFVPIVAIISPVICYLLNIFSSVLFNGYEFGFELLIVNGFITFAGLFILRIKNSTSQVKQQRLHD
ncbi:MAG TPA: sodium:solute symporter [Bacteroidales bacterium]|nr:sodium:solute symporter [Bacteroidales bacterium]HPS73737.1 sodium:solute symporter [Bacteroidales bacterium]